MLIIKFPVLGKEWTLRVLEKKKYKKKRGNDSVGITIMVDRKIDIPSNGINIETVEHELLHAYRYELCVTSMNKIKADDWEEFYAEFTSKYGRELHALADIIMSHLTPPITVELPEEPQSQGIFTTEPLPLVHWASDKWVGKSPCGNNDAHADVTGTYADVTCQKCTDFLKKGLN